MDVAPLTLVTVPKLDRSSNHVEPVGRALLPGIVSSRDEGEGITQSDDSNYVESVRSVCDELGRPFTSGYREAIEMVPEGLAKAIGGVVVVEL